MRTVDRYGQRRALSTWKRGFCRRILIVAGFAFIFCGSMAAADFQSVIDAFSRNQRSVNTFIGTGTMTIEMRSVADGALQKRLDSSIAVYMKYPNLFKLVVTGAGSATMVQKGNEMSHKFSGTDTVVTSKVDETGDLFKKFFGYEIADSSQPVQVLGQETVADKGQKLTRFILKPSDRQPAQSPNPQGIAIDRTEMDFDGNNMPVRIALFSGEKAIATTSYAYKKIGGTWVAETIATESTVGGARVLNTISYTGLSVNVTVSDREFELR